MSNDSSLTPTIIQHALTHEVLMLGYMNEESLEKTRKEKRVTFYSRSKKRLWTKGETSGNFLNVTHISKDCDGDTYLIKVLPIGATCHTGSYTCFGDKNTKGFLYELEFLLHEIKKHPPKNSYTSSLFNKGTKAIAQKVGEEATEVILEAMEDNKEFLIEESADLLYHLLVLLVDQDVDLHEIENILITRHQKRKKLLS